MAAIKLVVINNKAYCRMTGWAYGCGSNRVEDGRTQKPYDAPNSPKMCMKNGTLKDDILDDGFKDLMRCCSLCEIGKPIRERDNYLYRGQESLGTYTLRIMCELRRSDGCNESITIHNS